MISGFSGVPPAKVLISAPGGSDVDANSAAISSFTFTSRGLPKAVNGASQSGVYSLCSLDSGGNTIDSRAVVLSLSGRVRVSENVVISCP